MNKIALIIGGSSGIGFELSKLLLKNQYIVYNASRRESMLDKVINLTYDVTSNQPFDIINNIKEKRIDLFVYASGFSMASPLEGTDNNIYEYLYKVNYFGLLYLLKEVIPIMKSNATEINKAKIVVFSSIASVLPIPYDTFYSASKQSLNLLVREINYELNRFFVFGSTILIPPTKTQFTFKRNITEESEKTIDYFDYQDSYTILGKDEQNGYAPEYVSKKIFKIVKNKWLKEKVIIGWKYKFFYLLAKLLPEIFVNKLIRKHYNLN